MMLDKRNITNPGKTSRVDVEHWVPNDTVSYRYLLTGTTI